MTHIQIAICTYKRPIMLKQCLDSLVKIHFPEKYAVSIAVIDNDDAQTASSIVGQIAQTSLIKIHYVPEQRRGIPIARNKALDTATTMGVDSLIFIDDDELVSENWLTELISYAEEKEGKAIIHGRVISIYPSDAPKHLSPFFTKNKVIPTGKPLTSCATDNVLIPLSAIIAHKLRFNETRPLAGGTDLLFFSTAYNQGIEIFYCKEAVVHETVPLSRISVKWLSKRKFRVGIDVQKHKVCCGRSPVIIFISSTFQFLLRLVSSGLFFITGQKTLSIKEWLKVCRSLGSICGVLGVQVDSYRTIEGQ